MEFRKCILIWTIVLLSVQLSWSHPAEDKSTSTTTDKPVRHPSYVRLLNRKKNQNETESSSDKVEDSPSPIKTDEKDPASILASGRQNLTVAEIKNIVPFLDFTTESYRGSSRAQSSGSSSSSFSNPDRPRGIAGLFNLFRGPLEAIRNIGTRNRTLSSLSSRNERLISGGGSNNNSSSGSSFTKTSSSSPSNSIFSGPGRFIAGVVKMMQNMSLTFEQLIQSFTKLFNFRGSRTSS